MPASSSAAAAAAAAAAEAEQRSIIALQASMSAQPVNEIKEAEIAI